MTREHHPDRRRGLHALILERGISRLPKRGRHFVTAVRAPIWFGDDIDECDQDSQVMTICPWNDRAMTDWYRYYATRVLEACVAAGTGAACGNRPATKSMKAFTFAVACRCCG